MKSPSRAEMVESAREFSLTLSNAQAVTRAWLRYQRTGVLKDCETLAVRAAEVRNAASYALRVWVRQGAWEHYYLVPNGSVHNTVGCRSVNINTRAVLIPELVGLSVNEVADRGYKMCSHCLRRSRTHTVERITRFISDTLLTMDEVIAASQAA